MHCLLVLSLFLVFSKFQPMGLGVSTFPLKTLYSSVNRVASNSVRFFSSHFMQKGEWPL